MIHPREQTEAETEAWIEFFLGLQDTDYRQTKGRRGR
jgi:hypothetical protein